MDELNTEIDVFSIFMHPCNRINYVLEYIVKKNEENGTDIDCILEKNLKMNGYISKASIKQYLLFIFKNVSLSFDNNVLQFYPRKNFLSYSFVLNKIMNNVNKKSVIAKETKLLFSKINIGSQFLKSQEKNIQNEQIWNIMQCDENFKKWEQAFLQHVK